MLLQELHRRQCRASMTAWSTEALAPAGFLPAAHHRLMIAELEAIARGDNDRLMMFLPPGSAKSTYTSHLFPAWWFCRHPRSAIIAASHTMELAEKNGRTARNYILGNTDALGYGVRDDSSAAARWHTTAGGEYLGAGVGKAIAGFRADLGLLDDLVASREEADSERQREKTWDWYRDDFLTRLKPGARRVLIMTRWHPDDVAGRILDAEANRWRVLTLPALATDENDPLGRAVGEPLWSDDEYGYGETLRTKREEAGERGWWALYQQSPRPLEGSLFKTAQVRTIEAEPAGRGTTIVRAWDLAATAQTGSRDPDWTVGVKLMRTPEGRFVVLDVVRLRGGPDEVEEAVVNTAHQDGAAVRISLPQDPGQAGKQQVLYLTRKLAGFTVESSPETGDKATRAAPVASQVNVGNLDVVAAPWNRVFLDEITGFPNASKDDQVDALSRAFSVIGLNRGPMRISAESMAASMRRPMR